MRFFAGKPCFYSLVTKLKQTPRKRDFMRDYDLS